MYESSIKKDYNTNEQLSEEYKLLSDKEIDQLAEYEIIKIDEEDLEVGETEAKVNKKIFDIPLVNSVYNSWFEKKQREKKQK